MLQLTEVQQLAVQDFLDESSRGQTLEEMLVDRADVEKHGPQLRIEWRHGKIYKILEIPQAERERYAAARCRH